MSIRSSLLTLLLALSVLLSGLYLLRWPLLRGPLETFLREKAGEEGIALTMEGLSGPIFGSIRVERILGEASDDRTVVRTLYLKDVRLDFDFWRLIRGDLSALFVKAGYVALACDLDRPGLPDSEPEKAEPAMEYPAVLPNLSVRDGDLALAFDGFQLDLDQWGVEVKEGGRAGLFEAQTFRLRRPEGEVPFLTKIRCPLTYDRGNLSVGPLDAALMGGTLSFKGSSTGSGSFEAQDVDLGRIPPPWAGGARFGGRLDLSCALRVGEEGLEDLDLRTTLKVVEGRFNAFDAATLSLEGGLKKRRIFVDRGSLSSEGDGIEIAAFDLPLPTEGLSLDDAAGTARFHFDVPERWLDAAGVDSAWLAQASLDGEATLKDGTLDLERVHVERGEDTLNLGEGSLRKEGDLVVVEAGSLKGQVSGLPLSLAEPARISIQNKATRVEAFRLALGEGFIDLTGEIDEDLGVDANLRIREIDLTALNRTLPFLQGWKGSIETARLDLHGPLIRPGASWYLRGEGLAVHDLAPHTLAIEGTLEQGRLQVDHLDLDSGSKPILRSGFSLDFETEEAGGGWIPGPESRLSNLFLDLEDVEIAPYLSLAHIPAGGRAFLHVEGEGPLSDPSFRLSVSLKEGSTGSEESPTFDVAGKEIVFHEGRMHVGEITLSTPLGCVQGSGTLPLALNWDRAAQGRILDEAGPINGEVRLSEMDLTVLASMVPGLRRVGGRLTGQGILKGTWIEPEYQAALRLSDGTLRMENRIPALEEIEASLALSPGEIVVESMTCLMGGGSMEAQGKIPWESFQPLTFDIALKGEKALLYRDRGLRIRADLDVALKGPVDAPCLTGTAFLSDSRFVRFIPLVPGAGPPAVENQIQLFSLDDPFGRSLTFDLAVKTRSPDGLYLDNNLVRGAIRSDLKLRGTGEVPFFLGEASFDGMDLILPNFRFNVDAGRITFPADDPFSPRISLTARGRRQSHFVDLTVQGLISDPLITLSSSPPLDESSLIVLVTTGSLPDVIRKTGVEREALMQVGSYVGNELLRGLFGTESTEEDESFLDRFTLNVGTEVSPEGTGNVLLEYQIDGPFHIQLERDIYRDANLGFVYRIHFR